LEVRFKDAALARLEADPSSTGGFPEAVVTAFRKRMQLIRSAKDERDFYQLKSLRFEKLQGAKAHQHSMRLNDQWRLVIEFEGAAPNKTVIIDGIEDYHS
jgi:proteic killer suppression protein